MLKKLAERRARQRVAINADADMARGMLATRRAVQQHLPIDLLHDPSLDMLLSLFVADADGQATGAAELATTTTVGPAIASRLIKALMQLALIEEHDAVIALTCCGRAAVTAALAAARAAQAKGEHVRLPRLRMVHRRHQAAFNGLASPAPVAANS